MAHESTASKTRAADKLIALFEGQILDGSLPEGATLPPEREIVQSHGVSRTVVREAVLALSNKGLVKARPGFRPVVVRPGYDTVIDVVSSVASQLLRQSGGVRNLFDLRIMMEAALVREAAIKSTREDISLLRDALAENKESIGDSELFYKTDTAFHGCLYDIPGNPLLNSLHRAYTNWLAPHWSAMPRVPTRNQNNYEAHKKIYDAILLRDPDLAEAALRSHLESAWEQISTTFEELR